MVLFLGFILLLECMVLSDLFNIVDALAILSRTIPGIDVVNLDRLFLQDRVEWYSERHWIFLRQK